MLEDVFAVEFMSIFCYVEKVKTVLIPTKLTSEHYILKTIDGIVIMCIIAIINVNGATMLDTQSLGHCWKWNPLTYNASYSASL
jgi:hypothetical protein